jgi:hypothetical protein
MFIKGAEHRVRSAAVSSLSVQRGRARKLWRCSGGSRRGSTRSREGEPLSPPCSAFRAPGRNRSAPAAATRRFNRRSPGARQRCLLDSGEGAAPDGGNISTPLPLGWPGRVVIAKRVHPRWLVVNQMSVEASSTKWALRRAAPPAPRGATHASPAAKSAPYRSSEHPRAAESLRSFTPPYGISYGGVKPRSGLANRS